MRNTPDNKRGPARPLRAASFLFTLLLILPGCAPCSPAPERSNPATLRDLAPDQPATAQVCASACWNHTALRVTPGTRYLIEVRDEQRWWDWFIPTDADGYCTPLFSPFRASLRKPGANFFALVAAVDTAPDKRIVIGRFGEFAPEAPGELLLFANDLPGAYWNNWGSLTVTVTRRPGSR